jgi:hypothetical protein
MSAIAIHPRPEALVNERVAPSDGELFYALHVSKAHIHGIYGGGIGLPAMDRR